MSFLIDLIPKYFCLPFPCFCYKPQMLFFNKIHRLCKMIQASLNFLSKPIASYFKLRGCLNIYWVINSKIKLQVTPVTLISFKQEAQSFEFFQKMASEIFCKKKVLLKILQNLPQKTAPDQLTTLVTFLQIRRVQSLDYRYRASLISYCSSYHYCYYYLQSSFQI